MASNNVEHYVCLYPLVRDTNGNVLVNLLVKEKYKKMYSLI